MFWDGTMASAWFFCMLQCNMWTSDYLRRLDRERSRQG